MLREKNEGVMMYFKTITMNLLTIVHLLFEPITSLANPKAYLEESFSIGQLPWTVTSSETEIFPSLFSFFFFRNILRSNRYWWGTVENHVGNSADRCGGRDTTVRMNCTASRNCIYIIDLIKGMHVFFWGPSIRWKGIGEQSWASRSNNSLIPINLL